MGKRADNRGLEGTTDLGLRIRNRRKLKKWTQEKLARKIGVTKGSVSQWEIGDIKNIEIPRFFKLADALDVEARWLAIGDGPEERIKKSTGLSHEMNALAAKITALPKEKRDLLVAIFESHAPDDKLGDEWRAPQ